MNRRIFIDLEFTRIGGEIIRVQIIQNALLRKFDYSSEDKLSPIADIKTGGQLRYDRSALPRFSAEEWAKIIPKGSILYGYGCQEDIAALARYGITAEINDCQEPFIHSYPEYVVENGRSIELAAYKLSGGTIFNLHDGRELLPVYAYFIGRGKYYPVKAEDWTLESIIPYGRFAGAALGATVENERRSIDGYRYNNSDYLARMFNLGVDLLENGYDEYDDEDAF